MFSWRPIHIFVLSALIVLSIIVSVMAMLIVHKFDRSDGFRDALVGISGATVFFALVGAILLIFMIQSKLL
jgi:uncharacterized membrane protein YeaQ/YmgE (transglycosylase-associated protein family)